MPSDESNATHVPLFGASIGRLPLAVLVIGLLTTCAVTLLLSRGASARELEVFQNSARRTIAHMESRTDTHISMLRGTAGFLTACPGVGADVFHQYIHRLRMDELYQGMQGIGFSEIVPPADVAAYVERQRAAGRPEFTLWPDTPRDFYTAIVFLEPATERNQRALGFDMATEATRRIAMERARDTGRPAASGAVRLMQEREPDVQPGFLIYVPIYEGGDVPASLAERRARLRGFAYAPFRARDLFRGLFSRGMPQVAFSIYDGPVADETQLLFRRPQVTGHTPRHTSVDHLSVAGRRWTIEFESTPMLEESTTSFVVPAAFVSGSLLSLLLAGIVQLQRRNQLVREAMLDTERSAREESERVGRMKDEFLATLSHELRTPLTAILGWAELIRNNELPRSEFQTGLEVIQRNAEAQSQLINDLLDMSRIVSGKIRLDLQQVDLMDVIRSAVEVVQPMADSRRCSIYLHGGGASPRLTLDPHRIQQVIWNLLSNAVKFTPSDGRIDVFVARQHEYAEVRVRDTGQGIDPTFLPYVFDRFRQADSSSTRRHMGLGLGLSIVKSLVELHGGSVSAQSEGLGRGAQFSVRLPLTLPETVRLEHERPSTGVLIEDSPSAPGVRLLGVNVLLVEDEKDSREVIVNVLRSRGANVRATSTAEEALHYLEAEPPTLVISDIGMPGTDGYEFIRRVRQHPSGRFADVPAIALTAFARPEDRERALSAGYQVHLVKPVTPAVLVTACANLLAPVA